MMAERQQFYTVVISEVYFTVLNRYKNLRPIGAGAEGHVCSAIDVAIQRHVAIKKLTNPFSDIARAKRTYRELKLKTILKHKNLMGLLNAFTPQNNIHQFEEIYLVTELMNHNLCDVVRMDLCHDRMSNILYQIFCGLKYLHAGGIIHGNIKPSHIAVKSDCTLKILDFGLDRTNLAAFCDKFSCYYRAPEIIFGMEYTEKADIWSIGCIMGEMLRGAVLFPGSSTNEQWNRITEQLGTPSDSYVQRMPAAIRNYIQNETLYTGYTFKRLFPDVLFPTEHEEDCTRTLEARDLLSKMLVIDPVKRISIEDALMHLYLRDWLDDGYVVAEAPVTFDHSLINMDAETYDECKQYIYPEIRAFTG